MPIRQGAVSLGTARGRRLVAELASEMERARVERGLSYATIGRTLRLSPEQVARLCRGQSPRVSVLRTAQLLAVLGLNLSARAYPSGTPIRDAGHVALLARLRSRLAPDLRWRTEVPVVELPAPGLLDLRSWDASIRGPGWSARVEAETRIGDLQALQRRIALKQRDGHVDIVILVASDSRHNRAVVRAAGDVLRAQFPVSARRVLRRLADGATPAGNALLLL